MSIECKISSEHFDECSGHLALEFEEGGLRISWGENHEKFITADSIKAGEDQVYAATCRFSFEINMVMVESFLDLLAEPGSYRILTFQYDQKENSFGFYYE